MTTITEWLPVILPSYFSAVSIVSALWPGQVMGVVRKISQWQLQLLGLQGTLSISGRAVRRCRIFNLCMMPINGVFLYIGLHARVAGG